MLKYKKEIVVDIKSKKYQALMDQYLELVRPHGMEIFWPNTKKLAKYILELIIERRKLISCHPKSVIASCIYYACLFEGNKVTQKIIAEIVGTSGTTIYNTYNKISKDRDIWNSVIKNIEYMKPVIHWDEKRELS